MGTDTVREDFKNGRNGAVKLSVENLNQLDELYQVISPTRESGQKFDDECTTASDHIVSYLDGKDKDVVGTTYCALRSLVQQVIDCGYFDNMSDNTTGNVEGTEQKVEESVTQTQEVPQIEPVEEVRALLPAETDDIDPAQNTVEEAYYTSEEKTEDSAANNTQRNLSEIVSSVQGNFTFLHESQIEDSPHVDPAVVAAHPMSMSQQQTELQYSAPVALPNEQTQSTQVYNPAPLVGVEGTYSPAVYGGPEYMSQMMTTGEAEESMTNLPPRIPYPSEAPMSNQGYAQMPMDQQAMMAEQQQQQLNPNAPTFYSDQTSPRDQEKADEQSTDMQGSDYQGNSFRGRGQRGRGNKSMTNGSGFRGNPRGGGFSRGGNFGGNQGQASYQGYPAKNNYQPEGYQGYSNYQQGGFKGRGGSRGGGGSRSGYRGSGNRGGQYRGSSYNSRGGGGAYNQTPITT